MSGVGASTAAGRGYDETAAPQLTGYSHPNFGSAYTEADAAATSNTKTSSRPSSREHRRPVDNDDVGTGVTATQGANSTLDSQGRPARKRSLLDGQQQFGVTNNNYDGTQSSVTQAEPATAAAPTAARRNSAGRRRTGSGSSGIRAARAQHAQGDKSTQSTPTTDRSTAKPKKKGVSRFLALLGCCGAESTEDNVDDNTQEAKRIQKPRPTQPMQAQPVVTKEETPVAPPMATEVRDTAPPVVESSYQQAPTTSSEKQIVAPLAPSQLDTSSSQPGNFDEKSTYNTPSEPVSSAQRNLDKSLPATPSTISTSRATAPRMHRTESERHAAQVAAWPPTPLVNEEQISEDDEDIINDRTPEQAKIDEDLELSEAQPAVPIAPHEVVPVPAVMLPPEIRRQSTDRPGLRRGEASSIVNSAPLPPPPTERQSNPSGSVVHAAPQQKWLLPPVRPEHKGRKCLVLDLDETLVHSSFKILNQADLTIPVEIEGQYHNVYVIKRPGVDQFMKRVGEIYEVVVFTASVSKYGDPLMDQLDIHNAIHHRLFRESCYNNGGNYVKDLSQIGRPLPDTIIIDNSPTSYMFHPQHAVPISSWFSDAHDNELLDLIPVLEDLAGSDVRDVSLVLDVSL